MGWIFLLYIIVVKKWRKCRKTAGKRKITLLKLALLEVVRKEVNSVPLI